MARIVFNAFAMEPALQTIQEEWIGEIFAPQRFIANAGFGERSVEIEHPHQARPFTAPVGHGENGTLMREEPVQHVMAVLPHGFHHNERRAARDVAKHLHAVLLAVDETMALGGVEGMPALDLVSRAANCRCDGCFHRLLSRPALLVRGQAQIATGDKNDGFTHLSLLCHVPV